MVKELWNITVSKASELVPATNDNGIMDGIMMWISIAIMLVVFLPVLSAVIESTPTVENGTMNATQASLTTMVGSSYGLLIVVLIILAAVILIGVIAYLRQR